MFKLSLNVCVVKTYKSGRVLFTLDQLHKLRTTRRSFCRGANTNQYQQTRNLARFCSPTMQLKEFCLNDYDVIGFDLVKKFKAKNICVN